MLATRERSWGWPSGETASPSEQAQTRLLQKARGALVGPPVSRHEKAAWGWERPPPKLYRSGRLRRPACFWEIEAEAFCVRKDQPAVGPGEMRWKDEKKVTVGPPRFLAVGVGSAVRAVAHPCRAAGVHGAGRQRDKR